VRPIKIERIRGSFDFTLVTSANAFQQIRSFPASKEFVLIGRQTAAKRPKSVRSPIVLRESHSQGVLRFFKRQNLGVSSIFYPRSQRGDSELVRQLRKLRFRVTVRRVYTLVEHPNFKARIQAFMKRSDLKIFLLSSPSSLLFLKRRIGLNALKRPDVRLVAIGPTTRSFVVKYGLLCAEASKQDLRALVRAGTRLR
jgi:uroporphyrinogen-III synthase